jgi:hypothetical protein
MGRNDPDDDRPASRIRGLPAPTAEERGALDRLTRALVAVEVHILALIHARASARRATVVARRGHPRRAHRHERALDRFARELRHARRDRTRLLRTEATVPVAHFGPPGDRDDRHERHERRAA